MSHSPSSCAAVSPSSHGPQPAGASTALPGTSGRGGSDSDNSPAVATTDPIHAHGMGTSQEECLRDSDNLCHLTDTLENVGGAVGTGGSGSSEEKRMPVEQSGEQRVTLAMPADDEDDEGDLFAALLCQEDRFKRSDLAEPPHPVSAPPLPPAPAMSRTPAGSTTANSTPATLAANGQGGGVGVSGTPRTTAISLSTVGGDNLTPLSLSGSTYRQAKRPRDSDGPGDEGVKQKEKPKPLPTLQPFPTQPPTAAPYYEQHGGKAGGTSPVPPCHGGPPDPRPQQQQRTGAQSQLAQPPPPPGSMPPPQSPLPPGSLGGYVSNQSGFPSPIGGGGGRSLVALQPEDTVVKYPLVPAETLEGKYSYKPSDRIGEGTYGEVYVGVRRRVGGGSVAIKRFKAIENLDGLAITSVREISVLRHLATQPICVEYCVLLEEVCVSKDFRDVFLVFPFVEHSLSGLGHRPDFHFTEHETALIFRQLLLALEGLHRANILHRDIKPNNLLLTKDGTLKLCDFGLAVSTSSDRARLTPNIIAMDYRPPEMLLGGNYTSAVDVWCAGCCLAQHYLKFPPFYSREERHGAGELVQLRIILDALGPLTDISEDTRKHCTKFSDALQRLGTRHSKRKLRDWLEHQLQKLPYTRRPTIPQMAIDVMEMALRLDPQARPSPAELLRNPFFSVGDEFRVKQQLKEKLSRLPPSHEALIRRGAGGKRQGEPVRPSGAGGGGGVGTAGALNKEGYVAPAHFV